MPVESRSARSAIERPPARRTLRRTDDRFRVSHDVVEDSYSGREYERFADRAINVAPALLDQLDPELLDWHATEILRG
jgi:hypothetical protein